MLRKLVRRPIVPRDQSKFPNLAVLVDTETTGLLHIRDEIIEIGAVAFAYDDEGVIGDMMPRCKRFQVRVSRQGRLSPPRCK